jgi:hypothetical protein
MENDMAIISESRATKRLSKRLQRAGIQQWVAISSGDSWGKYLRFRIGGRCVGGCGWTLREAEDIVAHMEREVNALSN